MNVKMFFLSLDDEEKESLFMTAQEWKFNKINEVHFADAGLTKIEDWVNSQPEISVRLRNVLLVNKPFAFVEQVNFQNFFEIKNAGERGWKEFCELCGIKYKDKSERKKEQKGKKLNYIKRKRI